MAIKKYKPTTPGRRGMTTLANEEITKTTPEKSLTVRKYKTVLEQYADEKSNKAVGHSMYQDEYKGFENHLLYNIAEKHFTMAVKNIL